MHCNWICFLLHTSEHCVCACVCVCVCVCVMLYSCCKLHFVISICPSFCPCVCVSLSVCACDAGVTCVCAFAVAASSRVDEEESWVAGEGAWGEDKSVWGGTRSFRGTEQNRWPVRRFSLLSHVLTIGGGSKNFERGAGRKTIYQLRPHLLQMCTTKYMPFARKKAAFWNKYEPIGGRPHCPPPPLNQPLLKKW